MIFATNNHISIFQTPTDALVEEIDEEVGTLLETLGDEASNTLIIFTSDHGEMLGAHGKREKNNFYEGKRNKSGAVVTGLLRLRCFVSYSIHYSLQNRPEFRFSLVGRAKSFQILEWKRKSAIWM